MESSESITTRKVWFYRDYQHLTGGHLVHSHYYADVAQVFGFEPRITFGPLAAEAKGVVHRLWPAYPDSRADFWQPESRDILFLAGTDWRYLIDQRLQSLANPRINLIQHVRHAEPDHELRSYLKHRAIRICVSDEVADALAATGEANGPVFVVPNGCDVAPAGTDGPSKRIDGLPRITIVGYKNRPLAQALARKLQGQGVEHTLLTGFRPREAFLEQLAASSIAVCIPRLEEGFYLPALEAMASGCLLVTSDCIGNRSFCHHEGNCLIAEPTADALLDATLRVLALSHKEKQRLLQAARQTVLEHSLETQRARFREVLADIDQLW